MEEAFFSGIGMSTLRKHFFQVLARVHPGISGISMSTLRELFFRYWHKYIEGAFFQVLAQVH